MYFYLITILLYLVLEIAGELFSDPFQKSLAKVLCLLWIIKCGWFYIP